MDPSAFGLLDASGALNPHSLHAAFGAEQTQVYVFFLDLNSTKL
jgi:hypothetical protein